MSIFIKNQDYNGTFMDNTKAPVHRWFKYPAGYSFKLIDNKIKEYKLTEKSWILDPFVGCGTTSVVAKEKGVNSIGIEAHPFVYWVAKVKAFWEFDMKELKSKIDNTITDLQFKIVPNMLDETEITEFPKLLSKCYSPRNLAVLKIIRDYLEEEIEDEKIRDFLKLGLTDTLRNASKAGTGWPYIAPTKFHEKKEKNALEEFIRQIKRMYGDLKIIISNKSNSDVVCNLILGDSREYRPDIDDESIDLALTSPPYLNNYDYADRTRLETYFFGLAKTWWDITTQIRDKLMIAATTQVRRTAFDKKAPLDRSIEKTCPELYNEIIEKINRLGEIRLTKGGKKSYDLMVAGYFNAMFESLKQVEHVLKRGNDFVLVLGDSAPYGIHIPTEEFLGRMALGLGYTSFRTKMLRIRGLKWGNNPQRHKVLLKESILYVTK